MTAAHEIVSLACGSLSTPFLYSEDNLMSCFVRGKTRRGSPISEPLRDYELAALTALRIARPTAESIFMIVLPNGCAFYDAVLPSPTGGTHGKSSQRGMA